MFNLAGYNEIIFYHLFHMAKTNYVLPLFISTAYAKCYCSGLLWLLVPATNGF